MTAARSSPEPPPVRKLRGALLSISQQAERDLERLHADNAERRIHTLRVRMKKLRAILRLLKPGLSQAVSHGLRHQLRTLKRAFAMQRDQHVLQSLLMELSADGTCQPSCSPASLPSRAELRRLKSTAHALTQRLETMRVRPLGWDDIARAYARRYARARQGFRHCKRKPTAANLHRWRSPVKDHYLQSLLLLRDRDRLKLVQKLGSWLGRLHDFALLREHCRHGLASAIRHRMKKLRARIYRKAPHLFQISPRKLSRQMNAAL